MVVDRCVRRLSCRCPPTPVPLGGSLAAEGSGPVRCSHRGAAIYQPPLAARRAWLSSRAAVDVHSHVRCCMQHVAAAAALGSFVAGCVMMLLCNGAILTHPPLLRADGARDVGSSAGTCRAGLTYSAGHDVLPPGRCVAGQHSSPLTAACDGAVSSILAALTASGACPLAGTGSGSALHLPPGAGPVAGPAGEQADPPAAQQESSQVDGGDGGHTGLHSRWVGGALPQH